MTWARRFGARFAEIGRVSRLGAALVIAQAVAAILVVVLVVKAEGLNLPLLSSGRYVVTADFSDADGLQAGKKPLVTVAGVAMGTVTHVRYRDGMAVATLELKSEAKNRIFKNASALITPRSAINDLTVDITPGSPTSGPLGSRPTIPQTRTQSAVNLDRLTGVLNVDTRSQLAVLVDQLGIGLNGRSGALNQAIAELQPFLGDTSRLAQQMSQRRKLLSRLVSDLNVVFGTLGQRGQQLREVISAGRTTFDTVAQHQTQVAQTLRQLSPALGNVTNALGAVDQLSKPLAPALAQLAPLAHQLPPGLAALRRFVPSGEGLVTDLNALDTSGPAGVTALRSLLDQLGPASTALQPTVDKLLPVLQALNRHPAGIGDLGSHFSGVFSNQNANGPTLRAFGFFEPVRPENFGLPIGATGAQLATLRGEVASALDHVCLTANPLACIARYLAPGLPTPTYSSSGGLR